MKLMSKMVALYDKTAVKIHGCEKIPGSTVEFFYLVPTRYQGPPIILKDGTQITKNDPVLELHIINTNLWNLDTNYGNLFRMLREELGFIARFLEIPENNQFKAVFGITLLHRLAKRAGFTIIAIHNPVKRILFSLGENILRGTLSKKPLKKKQKRVEAKECWMSKDQILQSFSRV